VKTSLCLCGAEEPAVIPQKKTRRANTSTFSFQQHCIFCGEDCNLERDPKNPACGKPACYGQKCDTMSDAPLTAWAAKAGKGQVSTPRLCSLPPTTETFVENVKRAHHQASIWRSAKEEDPPELDVEKYGWKKDDVNRSLVPTTIHEAVNLAPDSVLKPIRCGCQSGTPCNSSMCGCRSANLSCTVFCACHDGGCCNANVP